MSNKILGFDGVRALAVISVVATHYGLFHEIDVESGLSDYLPLVHGGTGVQAFFILSGFLITSLLIGEQHRNSRISIKNFIIRRSLRIFPLYILVLVLSTLIYLFLDSDISGVSLVYAYTYIYNFIPLEHYSSLLGHTWSLAVEEHFYLIWPLFFSFLFPSKRKLLLFFVTLFMVASLLVYYFLIKYGVDKSYFIGRWSFVAGYNIAGGCLAALLLVNTSESGKLRICLATNVSFLVGVFFYGNSLYLHTGYYFIDDVISVYLRFSGILIILVWIYLNQSSRLVKILEISALRYIGTISYGVYMYQGLLLSTGPNRVPGNNWPVSPELGLLLLVIIAPLSFHFFEKPFLRIKSKF